MNIDRGEAVFNIYCLSSEFLQLCVDVAVARQQIILETYFMHCASFCDTNFLYRLYTNKVATYATTFRHYVIPILNYDSPL